MKRIVQRCQVLYNMVMVSNQEVIKQWRRFGFCVGLKIEKKTQRKIQKAWKSCFGIILFVEIHCVIERLIKGLWKQRYFYHILSLSFLAIKGYERVWNQKPNDCLAGQHNTKFELLIQEEKERRDKDRKTITSAMMFYWRWWLNQTTIKHDLQPNIIVAVPVFVSNTQDPEKK